MTREPAYSLEIENLVSHKHKLEAEIKQLRALLRRHHLRGAYWDSDLAVETRAALEPKP